MKDYYKILGLPPSATKGEIKLAYRKLAHQYHPDKNPANKHAEIHFSLIKEAYTTLTNPELRELYLQERWLYKSMNKGMEAPAITPQQILRKVLETHQQLIHLDEYRVDKKALLATIHKLINDEKILVLNQYADLDINHQIIRWMAESNFILSPKDQLQVLAQLEKIQAPTEAKKIITKKQKEAKQEILINQYKPWLILLVIGLLCIIIAYSL